MFEAGEMAIVGNVGPLLAPTDRASFEAGSVPLPKRLFSHNDQQSTWMSLNVEGTRVGWGGRFADAIIEADPTTNPLYVAVTTGGSDVFLAGEKGRQLKTVAETIAAASVLGVSRQIFYVPLGGFDNHGTQVDGLPPLQRQISEAVSAFRQAMIDNGRWNDVTVFTGSDFGRTTIDNGDGTDHGWGNHHFVLGGAVNGKRMYGDIPPPDVSLPQYTPTGGRLIPTTAIEQYAATLGRWFGLSNAELNVALPNRAAFDTGGMGFL